MNFLPTVCVFWTPSFLLHTFDIGTDQGSAMVGVHNGAGAILRKENPDIITVSFTNHALQLACATATKHKIPKEVSCVLI